ncbi:MAG: TIGR00730 family Rossman fold protein [Patescibacteria group bacterium]|jgi:hypothetical protein
MATKNKQKGKKVVEYQGYRPDTALKVSDNEIETWRIFKIMAEFISGFEFISKYEKEVTFFGSARAGFDKGIYQEATKLAYRLSKEGYAIMTGGGPGIMEAANKGAYEAGGPSLGANIKLPDTSMGTERRNAYVKESCVFDYFFVRKVILSITSQAYIFFPGGYGTLDELFDMITSIQTKKIKRVPIILVNTEFWTPLLAWIDEYVCTRNNAINKEDMQIYQLVNNADDAFKLIKKLLKN